MQPKTYIIVLNYNNSADTIECLKSLLHLQYDNFHIVLIDNASSDNSVAELDAFVGISESITFIQADRNGGYAAGNNIGIKYAIEQGDMEYVWILNNDTIVEKTALTELVKKMQKDKTIGFCGSKLVYEWDKTKLQGYGGKYNKWLGTSYNIVNSNEISKIDYVIGASVLVSKEFLDDVGLMSEDYFLYFEELDWARRAAGRYKLTCAADSIVYHKEGATIGANGNDSKNKSELADYFVVRNKIKFTKKYYPYCLLTVYIGLIWTIINRFRRNQLDRIPMILKLMAGTGTEKYEKLVHEI